MVVPRHKERFQTVAELIQAQGYKLITRSSKQAITREMEVFLGDTIGEMFLFYAAADLAFVGDSLVPIGGHNTLEPALLEIPSVVGPHVHNFKEITEKLKKSGGSMQIQTLEELIQVISNWVSNPEAVFRQVNKAKKWF